MSEDAALKEQIDSFVTAWVSGRAEFTVETSGSTGIPKQIVLKREQLLASARRTNAFFGLSDQSSALLAISPKTIGGRLMIVRALEGNYKLFAASPQANPFRLLNKEQFVDFAPLVPMQVKTILSEDPGSLQKAAKILLGGSPLSPETEEELIRLHNQVFMGFGMTETVSHIALRKLGSPVYEGMKGVRFSENEGSLIVWDDELGITALETNDSVRLITGTQFEWFGRKDFVINSGGIKIHPEQLERHLSNYIELPFFIAGKADATFGEICILIADGEESSVNLAAIQDICRERFGKYSVPREIVYTPVIFTSANKLNRKATLKQAGITA